jgi:ABC-type lipoprotein release transport system permease subunit
MGERGGKEKKRRSWPLRLFLIAINLFLFYLLMDYRPLEIYSYYIGSISLFLVILKQIKKQKISKTYKSRIKPSLFDVFAVTKKYLLVNKKYIAASVFGLLLATIIISQTMLISSSYEQDSFNRYMGASDAEAIHFDVMLDFFTRGDLGPWYETLETELELETQKLLEENDFSFVDAETSIQYSIKVIVGDEEINKDGSRSFETKRIESKSWTRRKFDFLHSLPTFDKSLGYNENDLILILDTWDDVDIDDIYSNGSIRMLFGDSSKTQFDDSSFYNISYPVKYAWKPSEPDFKYIADNHLWLPANQIFRSLLMNQEKQLDLYQVIRTIDIEIGGMGYVSIFMKSIIYMDLPKLSEINLRTFKAKLSRLTKEAQAWILGYFGIEYVDDDDDEYYYHFIRVYSPLLEQVQNYDEDSSNFQLMIIVISGPLIGLSLYLVYFSLTLVEQRKSRLISIIRIRGSSSEQLQSMLSSEVIMGALIATLVGMILSIPWAILSLKTSGIFEFNNPGISLMIPDAWYWKIPLIGIILAIDINIANILSLSKTNIDEEAHPYERIQPFWQRLYLDLILFLISSFYWIVIRIFPISDQETYTLLLFEVGPIMLLISLLSIPLVVARYFSELVSIASDILWKAHGGLFTLATRNMRINRFSASRLVALLMMGMMLSFMATIIPNTFTAWGDEEAKYNLGADIYIDGIDSKNQTQWEQLNVSGIASTSEIARITIYTEGYSHEDDILRYEFLGVNTSTFAKTAFWKNNYAKDSLSSIIDKFTSNRSVAIQRQQRLAMGLDIYDIFSVETFTGKINTFQYEITAEFDYFPNLVSYIPIEYDYGFVAQEAQILATIEMVRSMGRFSGNLAYEKGAYVKLEDNANMTAVTLELHNRYENMSFISIKSLEEETSAFFDADETKLVLSSLQSMLIVTILVSVVGVGYFSFITLAERNREIGTFRAIGMIKRQVFFLLLIEGFILLLAGLLFGLISGIVLSSNLFLMLTSDKQGGAVPPTRMIIPWLFMLNFSSILILLTILAAAIPAQMYASKQTGNVLRAV